MAIQTLSAGLWVPTPIPNPISAPALTFLVGVSDAAGKSGYLLQAPKTGNIRKVIWGTRTVTTGATVDVRIETIDATVTPAVPTGTLWGATTNGAQVVATADDNVLFTTTLTADAAVVQGDLIAVVLANASPGSIQMPTVLSAGERAYQCPYGVSYNGATWTATISQYVPMLSLEYSDGTYVPIQGCYPTSATLTTTTIDTTTTPDVAGLRFQFPFPCRVRGAWATLNRTGDYAIKLVTTAYNQGAGTGILASKTFDKDVRAGAAGRMTVTFDTAVELTAATNYRLLVEPTTVTALSLYDLSLVSAAQMAAWEGGANFMLTTAKDPTGDGSWTNFNSGTFRVPFLGLLLDGFDDGAAGVGSASAYACVG